MNARRPLAYIDLLGFKKIVQDSDLAEAVALLSRVFDAVFSATVRHVARKSGFEPS